MKRIIQILIVVFATCFLMSFLVPRPKLAMENEGTVADWMPVDTSPVIDYPARGFEVIHGRDEIKAEIVEQFAKQGGGTVASFEPKPIYGQTVQKTFEAKAIRAVHGDTLEILMPDNTHPNCRLASIDCPEREQAFGSKATEALKALCVGRTVTVHQTGIDGFKRPIVFVVVDGVNVNAELIRQGLAWHYLKHSKNDELTDLESEAKEAKRGLWADAKPVEPWRWRQIQKSDTEEPNLTKQTHRAAL